VGVSVSSIIGALSNIKLPTVRNDLCWLYHNQWTHHNLMMIIETNRDWKPEVNIVLIDLIDDPKQD